MSARPFTRRRGLGLWMATALVIGNMVESGVFLLPNSLAKIRRHQHPVGLNRIVHTRHPIRRADYELREIGSPTLANVLAPLIDRCLAHATASPDRPLQATAGAATSAGTGQPLTQPTVPVNPERSPLPVPVGSHYH